MASQAQILPLARLKPELGIDASHTQKDTLLVDWQREAVEIFESHTGREIPKADHTDTLGSHGQPRLIVDNPPILSVSEIRYDGTPIDADLYEIEDAETGFIRRTDGTSWDSTAYTDGTSIGTRTTGHEPAPLWEVDYSGGWVTPYMVDQDGDLSATDRTLPYDIQRAIIDYCQLRDAQMGRDPTLKSESLMSYSWELAELDGRRVPTTLPAAIADYRRMT